MRISKDLVTLEADIKHAPRTERPFTMRMEFRLDELEAEITMGQLLKGYHFFTFHNNLPDI